MSTPHEDHAKPDNLFGVCAALGEEFGFNPLWLRIALACSLLWNPVAVLAGYAAAGAAVWLIRRVTADPRPLPVAPPVVPTSEVEAGNDAIALPRAA